MLFSTAMDTVIGLLLIYLLLSAICTSVNEMIAGLLRLRGRVLRSEIDRVLGEGELVKAFWRTGLMQSIARGPDVADTPRNAPSYMDRYQFARAVTQAVAASPEGQVNAPLSEKVPETSIVKAVLRDFGAQTTEAVGNVEDQIAEWFDRMMDRASGVYKRYMSLISFLVALGIATAINADTLTMARTLWHDDALRAQFVEAAEGLLVGPDGAPVAEPNPAQMATLVETLLPAPMGWQGNFGPPEGEDKYVFWAFKGLGFFLTAAAATLGAPFWFDLLARFVALRNAGPRARDGTA